MNPSNTFNAHLLSLFILISLLVLSGTITAQTAPITEFQHSNFIHALLLMPMTQKSGGIQLLSQVEQNTINKLQDYVTQYPLATEQAEQNVKNKSETANSATIAKLAVDKMIKRISRQLNTH
ncbi:hypothetical protein [Yersinia hibernica]|uniref:Uncharacterized protein n=1 Tax=Yersinia enterocolitica LC20 TaxID=1443113 RepID=A0A7U4K232_YEREN|nr:hypothetical protein [Yersinia hibernica]AHM75353.2 hypothetical protein LC20_04100 [Yersinia hibernica]OVZ83263.1 hypothetical protein CBW54_16155 [Yersinia kristensenii]